MKFNQTESKIIKLLEKNYDYSQIAAELKLTYKQVMTNIYKMRQKTGTITNIMMIAKYRKFNEKEKN